MYSEGQSAEGTFAQKKRSGVEAKMDHNEVAMRYSDECSYVNLSVLNCCAPVSGVHPASLYTAV